MFENDKRLYISKNLCPPCNGSDINRSNILRHGALVSRYVINSATQGPVSELV